MPEILFRAPNEDSFAAENSPQQMYYFFLFKKLAKYYSGQLFEDVSKTDDFAD